MRDDRPKIRSPGCPHGVDWLHGNDRRSGRDEVSRELPGARADVDAIVSSPIRSAATSQATASSG